MSANLKKLMEDERVPAVAAFVRKTQDGGAHWSLSGEAGARQLLIHVVTKNHHTPIWCHAQGGSRTGRGVWAIPDVGTEVLVSFDNGAFEGDAFIVGEFGRHAGASLSENATLIVDGTVEIRSLNGTAVKLPTLADVQSIRDALHHHEHAYVWTGSPGSGTTTAGPLVPAPSGTIVLKAE